MMNCSKQGPPCPSPTPGAYWAPTDLGSSSLSVLSFCLFILVSFCLFIQGNLALSKEEPVAEIDSVGNCETEQQNDSGLKELENN